MDHNRSRKNSDHTDCTNKENAKPSFGKKTRKFLRSLCICSAVHSGPSTMGISSTLDTNAVGSLFQGLADFNF